MKYTATAPVSLPAGAVLALTDAQAETRAHALTPGKRKGTYTTNQVVQFKAGEVFGYEGELSKSLAQELEEAGRPAPTPAPTPSPTPSPTPAPTSSPAPAADA